jgi:hypothetical protein
VIAQNPKQRRGAFAVRDCVFFAIDGELHRKISSKYECGFVPLIRGALNKNQRIIGVCCSDDNLF